MKATHLLVVVALAGWAGPVMAAQEATWLGAFGHVPTAFDL